MEMDTAINPKKHNHKKVYGYLGCFIILASMITGELPQFHKESQDIETTSPSIQPAKNLKNNTSTFGKVTFNTEAPNRVYFVNDQPVQIDTTREGWIVELMYAQKKKENIQ